MVRLGFLILLALSIWGCQSPSAQEHSLESQLEQALTTDLLHHWFPAVIDSVHGGYLSHFSSSWEAVAPQNKFIVTQGRHLWTSSKAALFFPEDQRYAQSAHHGFPFLQQHLWDSVYGGFFTLVDQQGTPIPSGGYQEYKLAYGNAFAIYGLAAYYEWSGNEAALELAKQGFHWLEKHSHDEVNGGYFQYMHRNGKAPGWDYADLPTDSVYLGYKDYNSGIHLLEAFSELYHVWPDSLLKVRLREMLHIIRDTMCVQPGYLNLYFHPDWTHVSFRDSSESVQHENENWDHVTPGHDIETAFLLLEASEKLGEEYEQTLAVALSLVDHSLQQGYDKGVGGFFERGYYYPGSDTLTILDHRKNWWGQAEGLHSLLMFSQLFPEKPIYYTYFLEQWNYIQTYLMDTQHGGWYSFGIDISPEAVEGSKGNIWKSAYHNGRSLMGCLQMVREEK